MSGGGIFSKDFLHDPCVPKFMEQKGLFGVCEPDYLKYFIAALAVVLVFSIVRK